MLLCPNPDCTFARSHRRPAEYRDGFVTCSDCGSALAPANAVVAPAAAVAPVQPGSWPRIAVSAGLAVAAVAICQVPLVPPIRPAWFGGFFYDFSPGLSLSSVGLVPFATGFFLVELVALIVPRLRARRVGGFAERRPLTTAALGLGLVLMGWQTAMILRYLATAYPMGGSVVAEPTQSPWFIGVALCAASLALLALTRLNERFGIGNGFALVIGATALAQLLRFARVSWRNLAMESLSFAQLLVMAAVLGGVALATARWTAVPSQAGAAPRWVPVPSSTIQAIAAWPAVGVIAGMFGRFVFGQGASALSWQGSVPAAGAAALAAAALAYLFFRPTQVAMVWKQWSPETADVESWTRRQLPRSLGFSAAICAGLTLAPAVLNALFSLPLELALTAIVPVAAIGGDLVEEVRARRRLGPLVAIRPIYRLTEVEPVIARLTAANIPVLARTGRMRVLNGFFAPYAPVTLLVPTSRAEDARKILDR